MMVDTTPIFESQQRKCISDPRVLACIARSRASRVLALCPAALAILDLLPQLVDNWPEQASGPMGVYLNILEQRCVRFLAEHYYDEQILILDSQGIADKFGLTHDQGLSLLHRMEELGAMTNWGPGYCPASNVLDLVGEMDEPRDLPATWMKRIRTHKITAIALCAVVALGVIGGLVDLAIRLAGLLF